MLDNANQEVVDFLVSCSEEVLRDTLFAALHARRSEVLQTSNRLWEEKGFEIELALSVCWWDSRKPDALEYCSSKEVSTNLIEGHYDWLVNMDEIMNADN